MSQLFLKEFENHKTIFTWKQSLIEVPLKYLFFEIICEEIHFSVKLQALELKHLKTNCFICIFRVFFHNIY